MKGAEMAESGLAKKLRVLPGNRLLVLNAPEGYVSQLSPLPEGATVAASAAGTFDVVQAFAHDHAELRRIVPEAAGAIAPSGILWISWPKKTARLASDLDRDSLWAALNAAGWVGVASIAVNETWSALRFKRDGASKA
jgi:hypothetical protein